MVAFLLVVGTGVDTRALRPAMVNGMGSEETC
jgi:hypothetical protein